MIKLIAVNMSGTYFRDEETYDKVRFKNIFKKMRGDNIKFVITSGMPFSKLKALFSKSNKCLLLRRMEPILFQKMMNYL